MTGWNRHHGLAVYLPNDNIDTDQLIPARFMNRSRSAGYGEYLLYDQRRDEQGELNSSFVINRYPDASVLFVGKNFGCGSSREAAVYALIDAGISTVVSEGFGDIFAANAVNNGLLPALVDKAAWVDIVSVLKTHPTEATVDIDRCEIGVKSKLYPFSLNTTWRTKLLNGWDDIDITQHHAASIQQFREQRLKHKPWALPGTSRLQSS